MSTNNPPAKRPDDDIYAGLDPKTRAEIEAMEREATAVLARLQAEFVPSEVASDVEAFKVLEELDDELVAKEPVEEPAEVEVVEEPIEEPVEEPVDAEVVDDPAKDDFDL